MTPIRKGTAKRLGLALPPPTAQVDSMSRDTFGEVLRGAFGVNDIATVLVDFARAAEDLKLLMPRR